MMKIPGKNVVLLTIDSLRADHVSCLGYHQKTTPNIDKIAKKGTVFTQAFANGPNTRQSLLSILTSTYPLMFGGWSCPLSKHRITIAQVLREQGYSTAAIHSNPFLSSYFNYNRGFDFFEDFKRTPLEATSPNKHGIKKIRRKNFARTRAWRKLLEKIPIFRNAYVNRQLQRSVPYQKGDIINEKAFSWLKNNSENFFLWLHYMDPHSPYRPPREFLPRKTTYLKAFFKSPGFMLESELDEFIEASKSLYDAEIRYVDYVIGQFLRKLKELGVLQNTFVIITADHGEEFMEHGKFGHYSDRLYDELIHVPLIIAGNGIMEDLLVRDPVALVDLSPTILDLLGIEDTPKLFMGRSLFQVLMGEKQVKRKWIISETSGKGKKYLCYRTDKWKYILIFDGKRERQQLYNLQDDPKEKVNVSEKKKTVSKKFRLQLFKHISQKKRVEKMARKRTKISRRIRSLKKLGKI